MKTYLNLLILLIISVTVRAELQPYPMHQLFFNSNLIVHTKITNHTDHNYTFRINEIFRDYQIGIEVDDYIKIKKDFHIETSTEKVSNRTISKRRSGLAFLTKTKEGWHVNEFYIDQSEEDMIILYLKGCRIRGSRSDIKSQIHEYFQEFSVDDDNDLIGNRTAKQVKKSNLSQLSLLQYTKLYPFEIDKSVYKKLDCPDFIEAE